MKGKGEEDEEISLFGLMIRGKLFSAFTRPLSYFIF